MERKNIVITGATSGIGLHLTNLAITEGYHVIAVVRNKEKMLSIIPENESFKVFSYDLAKTYEYKELVTYIAELGKLDYLVNNAGSGTAIDFNQETYELTNMTFKLNVVAMIELTRELFPYLRKAERGNIINIASGLGVTCFPYLATYSASKHAVIGYTKSINIEFAETQVWCKSFCPFFTRTPFLKKAYSKNSQKFLNYISDPVEKIGNNIWKKRDSRSAILYPGLKSKLAWFSQLFSVNMQIKTMKILNILFLKKIFN